FSCSLTKALNTRAAAPGSSRENARTRGPRKLSRMHSKLVPSTARLASVFLTTFKYTPALRAATRSSVISATVSPRYSAAMADCALAATSATSATSAFLASRFSAMAQLLPVETPPRPAEDQSPRADPSASRLLDRQCPHQAMPSQVTPSA